MKTARFCRACVLFLALAAAGTSLWASGSQEAAREQKLLPLSCEIWDRNTVPADKGTAEDNKWTRWIRERVKAEGIDLSFMAVPRSDSQQRLNVLMASGTAPDIIFEGHFWIVAQYASQGGLHDLTEPLAKYGQDLAEFLGPQILEAGQLEGKQYAINWYGNPVTVYHAVGHIRQDWLDKLGLDMPKNTTELAYVLKEFKRRDPGGVGVENVIPWGKFRNTVNLWYSNGLSHDIMYSFMDFDMEKLYTTPEPLREGFKDWLAWCNDLYHSGCIDREFATRTSDEAYQQMMNNQVGFYPQNTADVFKTTRGVIENLRRIAPDARWVGCAPYAGKDGVARHMTTKPWGYYNMVPLTCRYPEAAVKYMQWAVKPDVMMIQTYGFEGEHYEWCDDGYPMAAGTKNGVAYDYVQHATDDFAYIRDDARIMGTIFLGADVFWKQIRAGYTIAYDAQTAEDVVNTYKLALSNGYTEPNFKLEMKTWTKYGAELRKAYDQYWVRCVMAQDFESEYAEFQRELKARGIEEYAAEHKAYYDRYVKAQ